MYKNLLKKGGAGLQRTFSVAMATLLTVALAIPPGLAYAEEPAALAATPPADAITSL